MVKRLISIILFIVFSCLFSTAQIELAEHYNFQDTIVSLKKQIEDTDDPKIKVQKLLSLSFYYVDRSEGMKCLEEAYAIADEMGDEHLKTEVEVEMATNYMSVGDISTSVELFDSAMPKYKLFAEPRIYYNTEFQYCKALYDDGRYYEALERALLACDFYRETEPQSVYIALLSTKIASIYNQLGKVEEAIKHFEIANELCDQIEHFNCKCTSFRGLANINLELGEIDKAKEYIQKAQETILNEPPLKWQAIFNKMTEAKIKMAEGEVDEALRVLEEGFNHAQRENWEIQIGRYHNLFADAYLQKGSLYEALKHSQETLRIGNERQFKSLQQSAHLTNSKIFEQLGNTRKSLESFRNYHNINESILSNEKISRINELDAKYKSALNENKINRLEKENALKQLEIERGNQRKLILYGGAIFLGILLLTVLYFLRKKSATNLILKEKNKIIVKSLEDKDILLREIHHRVKNNLQVVSSLLNLQSNYISDDLALEAITEGKNRVSSMALIHQNLYREENLTSIDTLEYFDDLLDNLFESYNIDEDKIQLTKEIEQLNIDVDTMIPLGLIVNELVSNALKHAFPNNNQYGNITVGLKEKDDTLHLTVSDNGIGMSKSHFLSSESFGNKIIKAFLQKLDAEIDIKKDMGTHVVLIIKKYKLKAA